MIRVLVAWFVLSVPVGVLVGRLIRSSNPPEVSRWSSSKRNS